MLRSRRAAGGLLACGAIAVGAGCGGDEEERSVEAFCGQVEAIIDSDLNAAPEDADAAVEQFEEVQGQLQELSDVSPEEIQGPVDDLGEAFGAIADAYGELEPDTPPEELAGVLGGLEEELTTLQEAGMELETYTTENCPDVDTGATAPEEGAPPPPPPGGEAPVPPEGGAPPPPPEGGAPVPPESGAPPPPEGGAPPPPEAPAP